MKYLVQEFVAGRWFTVRSFDNMEAASNFAAWLGRRSRVVKTEN